MFRLKNIEETKSIGLLENSQNALTLVEWPEKIKNKPKKRIDLKFEYSKNIKKRFLTIKSLDKKIRCI